MKYFILALCIVLAGCTQRKEKELHMNASDPNSFVSHCLGRHQFSLPTGFALATGGVGEFHPESMPSDEPAINLEMVATEISDFQYKNKVEARISELRAEKKGSGVDYLADVQKLRDDLIQVRVGNVETYYRSELHALKGRSYIVASLESSDGQYEVAESRLRKFVDGIVLAGSSADVGNGFCIGPLAINGIFKREWYQFSYGSAVKPDLVVSADIDTYSEDDPEALFQRLGGPSSLLRMADLKHWVIRKREIMVAGMKAQEWLGAVRLPERNDKKYGFVLETIHRTPGLMTPEIHLAMDSGEPGVDGTANETRMSDDEAVQFWDELVASIRPRKASP